MSGPQPGDGAHEDAVRAWYWARWAAEEHGWHVFPLEPYSKVPLTGPDGHRIPWSKVASGDPAVVARARCRGTVTGYGIACKLSGLVVVDLDVPEPGGAELPPEWRGEAGIADGTDILAVVMERAGFPEWPDTFTVRTPSGGMQMYYQAIPGRAIGNRPLGPMVDVRGGGNGNGGYVCGPGSLIDQRAYAGKPYKASLVGGGGTYTIARNIPLVPLPGWIADLLDPPERPAPAGTAAPQLAGALRPGYVRAAVEGELAAVIGAPPGRGNDTLNCAAIKLGRFVAAGQLDRGQAEDMLAAAAMHGGRRGQAETSATIRSGLDAALRGGL